MIAVRLIATDNCTTIGSGHIVVLRKVRTRWRVALVIRSVPIRHSGWSGGGGRRAEGRREGEEREGEGRRGRERERDIERERERGRGIEK